MVRVRRGVALLLLCGSIAQAHFVPIPPSACVLQPVELRSMAGTVEATADPPVPEDTLTLRYDAPVVQFTGDGPPRRLAAAGGSGSLALPPLFIADMQKGGDILAEGVDVTLTGAAGAQTVRTTLTTGLATDGTTVLEGSPMKPDGRFTLIALLPLLGIGPPLGGEPLVLALTGRADPHPDLDQFKIAETTVVSASLTAKTASIRALFEVDLGQNGAFPDGPAVFRASTAAGTIATAVVPGLQARGRRLLIGESADRAAAIGVRLFRKLTPAVVYPTYLLAAKVRSPALPASSGGPVVANFTFDFAGLVSRSQVTLKSNRRGTRFRLH